MMFCSHGTPRNDGQETRSQVSTKHIIYCGQHLFQRSTCQRVNVSRLRTYHRMKTKNGPTQRMFHQDHCYSTFQWQIKHPYACSGARSEMPASRLWKKLHKDMEEMFTLWTSMLFPHRKTKMWT